MTINNAILKNVSSCGVDLLLSRVSVLTMDNLPLHLLAIGAAFASRSRSFLHPSLKLPSFLSHRAFRSRTFALKRFKRARAHTSCHTTPGFGNVIVQTTTKWDATVCIAAAIEKKADAKRDSESFSNRYVNRVESESFSMMWLQWKMWQGRDGDHHRRSSSCISSYRRVGTRVPPPAPPRSAPATCRRPRRELGDRVFVTSPTAVFIEFRDENSNVIAGKADEIPRDEQVNLPVVFEGRGVVKFRNKSEVDGQEWQEVDVFIGKRPTFATTLTIVSFE